MLRELNEQLVQVQEQVAARSRLRQALDAAQDRLQQARTRSDELDLQLGKEDLDVRDLEGLSLTGLFYTLLGTKEQRLDVDRQELLAAQLRYEQARAEIDLLEAEVSTLEQQLTQFDDLDARSEQILAEKERIIVAANNEQTQTLFCLSSELATGQNMLREVDEALAAAREVLQSLGNVGDSLRSAGNWGVVDMLGGGMLTTMIKHGHIDDAHKTISHVQHLLRRLHRELDDIHLASGDLGDMSEFETFADYFFDDLITDWIVQSRINRSAAHIQAVTQRVHVLSGKLEQKRIALQREVGNIKLERLNLLERAT